MEKVVKGKIIAIKRLRNSYNGNPRFQIVLAPGGAYNTVADAQVGYAIGNPGLREGDTVTVTLSGRGTIANMEPVTE